MFGSDFSILIRAFESHALNTHEFCYVYSDDQDEIRSLDDPYMGKT